MGPSGRCPGNEVPRARWAARRVALTAGSAGPGPTRRTPVRPRQTRDAPRRARHVVARPPVTGPCDGWSLVQFSTRVLRPLRPAEPVGSGPHPSTEGGRRTGRRRATLVTGGALALVLAAGSVAYGQAHKTVTLDVDGQVRTVGTFAGSVDDLLADESVGIGARDAVSPAGALREGAQVVVRHAHRVLVSQDGVRQTVWTTALSADEALETLSAREGDLALVASRSGTRLDLPLDLSLDGATQVVVDGRTVPVPDGDATVQQVLDELDVVLQPLDEVTVERSDTGRVQVVVARVVVQQVTTTHEVPFASTTRNDPSRSVGTKVVVTAGVPGTRTVVETVTTVDGVPTARVPVSDEVTVAPVDEVVAVGTKARPVAAAVPASGGSSGGLNWGALAACESGGRVDAVSASGRYHGLYQFSVATWQGVGGSGLPSQASAAEQTARAQALYERSGAGQWPVCGKNLFR